MVDISIDVAVPWSLSHYIPLNGFHPLYRALFDDAPSELQFHGWDNVKLYRKIAEDPVIRARLIGAVKEERRKLPVLDATRVAKSYREFFGPLSRTLTGSLIGGIELHQTAPFPSFKRPFVLQCESFAPVFLPFAQQGSGAFKKHSELRERYRRILSHPMCLGVYSHIPETLDSLSRFFADAEVDRKLFRSRVGLSEKAVLEGKLPEKVPLSRPRFLFINSAHQNPDNFFRRGGHIVLRFWKAFRDSGRTGLLMLRCAKPSEQALRDHDVDTAFISAETGSTVLWSEDYLANQEMNALVASAHFFLLPSFSLHSVSIMQAMMLGAVPVVTDTVGTAHYVTDEQDGIVLRGMRSVIWRSDPNVGILVDWYGRVPSLERALVSQLMRRISALLDAPEAYWQISSRSRAEARNRFSGRAFSDQFWGDVIDLYHRRAASYRRFEPDELASSLAGCTLQGEGWRRIFESPTQPMRRIQTGQGVVWELGGAFVHAYGNPSMELSDWSPLAQYWSRSAPRLTFASALTELDGKYLTSPNRPAGVAGKALVRLATQRLVRAAERHRFGARVLNRARRWNRRLRSGFHMRHLIRAERAGQGPNRATHPKLILEGYRGFNIILFGGEYYAIPQGEGPFELAKVRANKYPCSYSASSLEEIQKMISNAI